MLVRVKVSAESREEKVIEREDGSFEIWVKERPVNGLANIAARSALAHYLGVDESKVRLIKGFRERSKIFDIEQN